MNRLFLIAFLMLLAMTARVSAECTTIQSGSLLNSANELVSPGYDQWGYNYQAMMFNGTYCDAYRNASWCQQWANENLMMKWNAAWLSNVDCNNDGVLDRHLGYAGYKGSGAWLTNHQSGKVDVNGRLRTWTYFVKIVAVEPTDTLVGGEWFREGIKLGPQLWGDFAIVEEVLNDPSTGAHGVLYKSPVGPGFGSLTQ